MRTKIHNEDTYLMLAEEMPIEAVNEIVCSGDNEPACLRWLEELKLKICPKFSSKMHKDFGLEPTKDSTHLAAFVLWCAAYDAVELCGRE